MTGPKLALQPIPEEPWLTSDRVGKPVEFSINTSAPYWVLNMGSCKLSHESCKIIRVSGKEIFFWVTEPNCATLLQSCPPLCDPMDCSPPGSSVHGILQARILEWIDISSPEGYSPPRDQTRISYVSCIGRQVLYQQRHLESPDRTQTYTQKTLGQSCPKSSKNAPIILGENLAKHLEDLHLEEGNPLWYVEDILTNSSA